MTSEHIQQMRKLLIQACDAHVAAGKKIISGAFSNPEGYCPISCLVGNEDGFAERLAQKLGIDIDSDTMWSFIDGFDDNMRHHQDEAFALGKELRQKYLGK